MLIEKIDMADDEFKLINQFQNEYSQNILVNEILSLLQIYEKHISENTMK
jgi:hypothetical protein